MIGDGYNEVIHCPNAEVYSQPLEPDGAFVYCPLIHVSRWKKAATPEVESSGPLIAKGN